MITNILKYKYVLGLALMTVWVYVVPLHLGKIDNIGISNSNEYYSVDTAGNSKLISFATIERNEYLENNLTLRLAIDSLEEVPKSFIDCIITQEDRGFFTNPLGINLRGLGRVFLGGSGGGSGICQQTIKNIFFTSKTNPNGISNLNRKLAELLLTVNFSRNYSRNEILRTYLNNIYFATTTEGDLYGLKLASQYHFNKKLKDISLAESAVLARFINSPSIRKTEVIKEKSNVLLQNMLKLNSITQKEYDNAIKDSIIYVQDVRLIDEEDRIKTERGFVNLARKEKDAILKKLGIEPKAGLKIYTTMNGNLQRAIQDVYYRKNKHWRDSVLVNIKRNGKDTTVFDNLQCAVFCIDKNTGAVLGLLDGRADFGKNWNNYCFTKRQAGSIFKIFDYYTLFQNQPTYSANSLVPDLHLPNRNYPSSHTRNKNIAIKDAVSISTNIVPYNLVYNNLISIRQIQEISNLFGVKINNPENMATLIGQDDVSLSQMVNAYNTVSNEGYKKENYYISKITNRVGKILYEKIEDNNINQALLNSEACKKLKNCFNGVINTNGTAEIVGENRKIQKNNSDYGGKTGTTDNASNLWYIGYTPKFTMGIWQGYTISNTKSAGAAGSDCANLWSQILTLYNGR